MDLTSNQIQAVGRGDAVAITVDGRPCVVLRRDIYNRMKRLANYDESEWNFQEAYPAILAAWDQEEGPGLDAYQDYKHL